MRRKDHAGFKEAMALETTRCYSRVKLFSRVKRTGIGRRRRLPLPGWNSAKRHRIDPNRLGVRVPGLKHDPDLGVTRKQIKRVTIGPPFIGRLNTDFPGLRAVSPH